MYKHLYNGTRGQEWRIFVNCSESSAFFANLKFSHQSSHSRPFTHRYTTPTIGMLSSHSLVKKVHHGRFLMYPMLFGRKVLLSVPFHSFLTLWLNFYLTLHCLALFLSFAFLFLSPPLSLYIILCFHCSVRIPLFTTRKEIWFTTALVLQLKMFVVRGVFRILSQQKSLDNIMKS